MRKYQKIMSILLVISFLMMPSNLLGTSTIGADEKIVYLTFDDGPTDGITDKILDVLKEENVKATFFVVGKQIPKREHILKRIYEEGHGIGLHTYSHNFKEIYRSNEGFVEEMQKVSQTINEALGKDIHVQVIRFPGGSAGRLTQDLLQILHQKQYKIYDWNVDLKDGINGEMPPCQIVANAKKSQDYGITKIILAHCNTNNNNTCLALKDIITYYKQQGYRFEPITNQTHEYYYRIRK